MIETRRITLNCGVKTGSRRCLYSWDSNIGFNPIEGWVVIGVILDILMMRNIAIIYTGNLFLDIRSAVN
jgi:hypothetical protein